MQKDKRVRRMTPKEYWRATGISDTDFDKAENILSDSQLYNRAGNAIVVNVLESIFENISKGDKNMTLRVFEAFAGIGTQHMALRNIGADYDVVAIAEVDEYAILSYDAIHTADKPIEEKTHEEMTAYLEKLNIPMTKKGTRKKLSKPKTKALYEASIRSRNLGDVSQIEPTEVPDHDLFTYSFPCQDISVAGKGKGFEKGSGTRSGLLWECEKVIRAKKPKYLLMENVKNLISKKFKPGFEEWLTALEELGYSNYYSVLNAKDYGIPQNRERVFCVSILGEHEPYKFPEKEVLELRLKDVLEDEVDEKYYLDDDKVSRLTLNWDKVLANKDLQVVGNTSATGYNKHNVYHENGISPTLMARDYKGPNQVLQVGQYDTETRTNSNRFRTYNPDGISASLTTMGGGGREPHVMLDNQQPSMLIKNGTKRGYLEATDGDGVDLAFPNSTQRRGRVQKDLAQTLDTSDSKGVVVSSSDIRPINPLKGKTNNGWHFEQQVYDKNGITRAVKAGGGSGNIPKTIEVAQTSDTSDSDSEGAVKEPLGTLASQNSSTFGPGYIEGLSKTLRANKHDTSVIYSTMRIRKLTPKECWRLMGATDEDFAKAAAVNSNSQLYKQAGNAIVVDVLERIFAHIFSVD